jgi:hypothetical protein
MCSRAMKFPIYHLTNRIQCTTVEEMCMKWFAHMQHRLIMRTVLCLLVIRLCATAEERIAKSLFRNRLILTFLVMTEPLYMIDGFFQRWNALQ